MRSAMQLGVIAVLLLAGCETGISNRHSGAAARYNAPYRRTDPLPPKSVMAPAEKPLEESAPIFIPLLEPGDRGLVTSLRTGGRIVEIALGDRHGVIPGMQFEILRGDARVGTVRVSIVYNDACLAGALEGTAGDFRAGDTAKRDPAQIVGRVARVNVEKGLVMVDFGGETRIAEGQSMVLLKNGAEYRGTCTVKMVQKAERVFAAGLLDDASAELIAQVGDTAEVRPAAAGPAKEN